MLSVLLSNQFAFTFLCSTRVHSSSHRSIGFFCFWQKLVRSFLICAVRLKEINSTGIGTDYWNFVKVTTLLGMKGYLQVAERALCLHSPYCLKCPVPQWRTVGNSAPPQTENTSKKARETTVTPIMLTQYILMKVGHFFPLLDERMDWIWQHNFSHGVLTTLKKHAQDTQLIKTQRKKSRFWTRSVYMVNKGYNL